MDSPWFGVRPPADSEACWTAPRHRGNPCGHRNWLRCDHRRELGFPDSARGLGRTSRSLLPGSWRQLDGPRQTRVRLSSIGIEKPASLSIGTDDHHPAAGGLRRVAISFPLRYLHLAELELLLEVTGFRSWQVYGSYELDHFTDESDRLIVIAE